MRQFALLTCLLSSTVFFAGCSGSDPVEQIQSETVSGVSDDLKEMESEFDTKEVADTRLPAAPVVEAERKPFDSPTDNLTGDEVTSTSNDIAPLTIPNFEKRRYLKSIAPAVTELYSLEMLYREFPHAKSGNHNRNPDGSLEIFWGDNLVQHYAMVDTKGDRVVAYGTKIFRGTQAAAQRSADEPQTLLGKPSPVSPGSGERDVVRQSLWNALGYGVRTAVIRGTTTDGRAVYFCEFLVSDLELARQLAEGKSKHEKPHALNDSQASATKDRVYLVVAKDTLRQALEETRKIESVDDRTSTLVDVALGYADAGHYDECKKIVHEIEQLLESQSSWMGRAEVQCSLAKIFAKIDEKEQSIAVARSAVQDTVRNRIGVSEQFLLRFWYSVAIAQAWAGLYDEAIGTAQSKINGPDSTLVMVVSIQARNGDTVTAKKLVSQIESSSSKAEAYAKIAFVQAERGDTIDARNLIKKAIKLARNDGPVNGPTLYQIAIVQRRLGDLEGLRETVSAIPTWLGRYSRRLEGLTELAEAEAEAGNISAAEDAVAAVGEGMSGIEKYEQERFNLTAQAAMARGLARSGNAEGFRMAAEKIIANDRTHSILAEAFVIAGDYEKALALAVSAEKSRTRVKILLTIAEALKNAEAVDQTNKGGR